MADTQPASGAQWQYAEIDNTDSCADIAYYDGDGNGNSEVAYFDANNGCKPGESMPAVWETKLYDLDGDDSLLEVLVMDQDENNIYDVLVQDIDGAAGNQAAFWVNRNPQDGAWDAPEAPASSSQEIGGMAKDFAKFATDFQRAPEPCPDRPANVPCIQPGL